VSTEVPLRVEYSLTERGMALRPVLQSIENWASDRVQTDLKIIQEKSLADQ
jgi:DNA-binding HxlR family transcriptional regulator